MVLPDLPLLLEQLNGREYIWLIIPTFATVALLSRPFSGKISDIVGRVFVMIFGAFVTAFSGLLYIYIPFLSLFLILRGFHGLSAGFTPTGFTAYADDIVPLAKRGQAMGIIGVSNNVGNALGWVIGSEFTKHFGLDWMFLFSSFLGLVSMILFATLKESIPNKAKFKLSMLKINKNELIEKKVLLPSLVFLLTAFSSGAILALIADFSAYIHVENKGLYMAVYILASVFIRLMAGEWSDRYGRVKIVVIGCLVLFVSMFILAFSNEIVSYLISSVCFGIAFGLLSPSVFAWAVDLSLPGQKGKAVGTLFIFMELGIIIGSSVGGLVYQNNTSNFIIVFLICAALALSPLFIIYLFQSKQRSQTRL